LYLLIGMTNFSSKWIFSHSTWYKSPRSRHYHSASKMEKEVGPLQPPAVNDAFSTVIGDA